MGFLCKLFNPLLLQGGHYDFENGWWVTSEGVTIKPGNPEWVTYFGGLEPGKLKQMFGGLHGGGFHIGGRGGGHHVHFGGHGGVQFKGLTPERMQLLQVRL